MKKSRWIYVVFFLSFNFHIFGDITYGSNNKSQFESSVTILEISHGRLMGMSREREEYYVIDSISSKLENQILLQVHQLKDGALKETVHLKYGDCASPSELCDPTFVQYHDNKFFIYDLDRKISIYNSEFIWLYSSRYYKNRHFVNFWGEDSSYFFVFGEQIIKRDQGELSVLLNSFSKSHLIQEDKIIDKFFVEYKRKRYTNNGVQFVDIPYFCPIVNGFEQSGKIVYCINTRNNYVVFDPANGSKKNVSVPQLKEKVYTEKEAQLAGYFKTDGFEERRKKAGLVLRYTPYHEKVFHLGMMNVGENLLGFISSIDFGSNTIDVDVIQAKTGEFVETVKLPAGKSFFKGLSMAGPGFNQSYFCYDKNVYIWQDVNDEYETITCLGVLKKD